MLKNTLAVLTAAVMAASMFCVPSVSAQSEETSIVQQILNGDVHEEHDDVEFLKMCRSFFSQDYYQSKDNG